MNVTFPDARSVAPLCAHRAPPSHQAKSALRRPFSVVIPAFNEEEALPHLLARIEALPRWWPAEFIFVDDGSTDRTAEIARASSRLRCVMRPHKGKTAALHAGFAVASHPIVVTIDADLQEDLDQIPELVEALADADLAHGRRVGREDSFFTKVFPSQVYNRIIAALFRRDFGDINCGFRAMRLETASALPTFEGAHRLAPLVVHLRGGIVRAVPVRHRARSAGRSKYRSPARFVTALLDLVRVAATHRAS